MLFSVASSEFLSCLLLQALLGLFLVFLYRFAARRVLDERVGELGKLLALNGIEGDGKNGVLAFKLLRLIVFRELDGNVFLFARVHAHHLLFKAGNELSAAQRQIELLRLGRRRI